MALQDYVRNALGKVASQINEIRQEHAAMQAKSSLIEKMLMARRSITEEIDKIKGRRIFYNLTGNITFTIADDGRRGQPISMLVSQDGPFVQTHYPFAIWRPSQPTTATNFGLWRPVSAWPLPDQAVSGAAPQNLDEDIISISYEQVDGGSQRNFQNEVAAPVLSRPDLMVPLSVPTLFTPNTTIQFFPTYERILFNNQVIPPTEGTLVVTLPGYRIVNM